MLLQNLLLIILTIVAKILAFNSICSWIKSNKSFKAVRYRTSSYCHNLHFLRFHSFKALLLCSYAMPIPSHSIYCYWILQSISFLFHVFFSLFSGFYARQRNPGAGRFLLLLFLLGFFGGKNKKNFFYGYRCWGKKETGHSLENSASSLYDTNFEKQRNWSR